jgi:Lamin Tail Domain/CHU_C Type IX secretion signal domain
MWYKYFFIAGLFFYSSKSSAQIANAYDVVIDELMIDPTPQVALPNNEWIEIKNTSTAPINLLGWRLSDATGQSGPMPSYNLLPDSVVIICASSALSAMNYYGAAIAVTSFPNLDNVTDVIYLRSPQNKIIHTVNYTDAWYKNELKKDGGWALEMIDTKNPCTGFANWKASTDVRGGSPGKKNSVDAINKDDNAPQLVRAYAIDNLNITIVFDEPIDSLKAATVLNYSVNDGIGIPISAVASVPFFDRVNLKLNTPLLPDKIYLITAKNISDCANNTIGAKNTARVGLPKLADSLDIIVNEILFNPNSNGTDFVEIYNRSNKIIDLKQLYIANRSTTAAVANIKQISSGNYLLFPQDFMVITEDAELIKAQFICKNFDAFISIPTMPSYNDDKGDVIILNQQGKIIDELKYDEKWHFKLIDNKESISLERIDYNSNTQQQDNWHSAATSAGYGTPTYVNSQYKINETIKGDVTVTPPIISPDNDGMDDFATIAYNFSVAGNVANITIFDASGRAVRYLQRNALCGTTGKYVWDGLGEKNQLLPQGIYVMFTQVFNLQGQTKTFKIAIVLATKNN